MALSRRQATTELIETVSNPHTCSETSYRITDVECISRAKNNPVKLTGMFGRFEVTNVGEVFFQQSSDAA